MSNTVLDLVFQYRGIDYTVETTNLKLAERYYAHTVDGNSGRLTWREPVQDIADDLGVHVNKVSEMIKSSSSVLVEGARCRCGAPAELREDGLSRSRIVAGSFYPTCPPCKEKEEARAREAQIKYATERSAHAQELAHMFHCLEELRATNKNAWRILVQLYNGSQDNQQIDPYDYEPTQYQLTDLADNVGISEANAYEALKTLQEFISIDGMCMHAESLRRVCACCRSFSVEIKRTVWEALEDILGVTNAN